MVSPDDIRQPETHRHSEISVGADSSAALDDVERLRGQIRKLILMKETGPKSAAWHRARIQTIWRLQRQVAAITSSPTARPTDYHGYNHLV